MSSKNSTISIAIALVVDCDGENVVECVNVENYDSTDEALDTAREAAIERFQEDIGPLQSAHRILKGVITIPAPVDTDTVFTAVVDAASNVRSSEAKISLS